ncbi:MAG: AAA family ATPase [Thermotogaceae bacterium]|nr:AAA family ATPase [Thermotogaceae bacterium]
MKKLPIGISEFSEMIKGNYYYVDKTLLIKDIIDLPGKVKLITRPRRFGKTLNMKMLQEFFSLSGKEGLFNGLKICKEEGIVKDYYRKYPVIFITFKSVKNITWKDAYENIKNQLSELAMKYSSFEMIEGEKEKLLRAARGDATTGEYANLLGMLTEILYKSTGKRTILLIDEYDVPIETAYTYREKDRDYYDNMVAFMRNLLTAALKDNEYLEFGILTGVYRIAKESIFSGLNNLAVYTIFDNEMADKYGFTQEEVDEMLKHYGLGREDKEVVYKWYGNYKVGKTENLYNPWSIVNYIAKRTQGGLSPEDASLTYWISTSSNDLIVEQIYKSKDIKEKLDVLIKGDSVNISINPDLSLRELEEDETGVWVLFASSGYLSAKRIKRKKYSFRIPNEEILEFFKESVQKWIRKKTKIEMKRMYDALDEMMEKGEYDKLKEKLEEFLLTGLSYYDVAKNESERFYKGFLLGMLAIAVNGYAVESEMESGYGRLDVVVYPKSKEYGNYAAIFEVKRADKDESLEKISKEALNQIRERKYHSKMKKLGYKVIGFGIAFCGKKVKIQVDTL